MTNAYLDRFVEEQRLLTAEAAGHSDEQTAYLRRIDHVGRRVAELQLALASRDDIVAFAPEPIAADDVRRWTRLSYSAPAMHSVSWHVAAWTWRRMIGSWSMHSCRTEIRFPCDCANCFRKPSTQ